VGVFSGYAGKTLFAAEELEEHIFDPDAPSEALRFDRAQAERPLRIFSKGPKKKPEAFAQRAALRYADKIQAVTLILHGSEDHRGGVVNQARLLAEKLHANGKDVHLRVYDSTPHSIPIPAQWQEIEPFLKRIIGQ